MGGVILPVGTNEEPACWIVAGVSERGPEAPQQDRVG